MSRISIGLRWGDLDAQGHINNVVYLELLQEARVTFLLEQGLSLLDDGIIVTRHQVEYVAPASDISVPVLLDVHIEDVHGTSFTFVYTMHHDGTIVLRARTACAAFDFETQQLRRLSDEEREILAGATATAEPLRDVTSPELKGWGWPHQLEVRWSDQDAFGHVNNVEYYGYFQEARIAFTVAVDPSAARNGQVEGDETHLWLVARQDVSYLGQMFHRDRPYYVRNAIASLGTTSVTYVAEIVDAPEPDADVLARQTSVLVCANHEGPTALPASFREAMTAWLLPSA